MRTCLVTSQNGDEVPYAVGPRGPGNREGGLRGQLAAGSFGALLDRQCDRPRACAVAPERKHYGLGRWPQAQFYAIVASYLERGREPDWIGRKLGVSTELVHSVAGHLELDEAAGERAARD